MAAYVEGRPMPASSSAFTNAASEYRGGGWVNFCCGSSFLRSSRSPFSNGGSAASFSSSSSPESEPSE